MAPKKRKREAIEALKKRREQSPADVDWELAISSIESAYDWVQELLKEEKRLKKIIWEVSNALARGNRDMKKTLRKNPELFKEYEEMRKNHEEDS